MSFLYNLEESIKEMILKWSKKDIVKDLEYVKKGEDEFIDSRGKISNHELTEPINLIGLIHSKKRNDKSKSLSSSTRTKMFIHQRSDN